MFLRKQISIREPGRTIFNESICFCLLFWAHNMFQLRGLIVHFPPSCEAKDTFEDPAGWKMDCGWLGMRGRVWTWTYVSIIYCMCTASVGRVRHTEAPREYTFQNVIKGGNICIHPKNLELSPKGSSFQFHPTSKDDRKIDHGAKFDTAVTETVNEVKSNYFEMILHFFTIWWLRVIARIDASWINASPGARKVCIT